MLAGALSTELAERACDAQSVHSDSNGSESITRLQRTLVPPPLELVARALVVELVPVFVMVEVAVTVEPPLPVAEALEVTVPPTDEYVYADGDVPPLAVAVPAVALPAPKARPSKRQEGAKSFETFMEDPTCLPSRWISCTKFQPLIKSRPQVWL
jgi:hypothetical protein